MPRANEKRPDTPAGVAIRAKIGGLANVARNGRQAAAAPLAAGLSAKLRAEAIRLGAVTESEIQERMSDLRKLQATRAAHARWHKK